MERRSDLHPTPLEPFLLTLCEHGFQVTVRDYERIALLLRTEGPWTVQRLRDALRALLARDEEQVERFDDCFRDFFDLDLVVDPETLLGEQADPIAPPEPPPPPPPLPTPPLLPSPPPPPLPWLPWVVLLVVAGVLLLALLYRLPTPPPPLPEPPGITATPLPPAPAGSGSRIYPHAPFVEKWQSFDRPRSAEWLLPLVSGLLLLTAAAVYALLLYPRRRPPDQGPPRFDADPDLPRHFSPGLVGGRPAPLLSDADLDEFADLLGYFATAEAGSYLDVRGSVEATLRRGGVPTLTFFQQRRLRSVLILVDSRAEALRWHTLPAELATGLSLRGVPVLAGSFSGVPDRYTTADGVTHLLEDLEDQRHAFVLLIFSDGDQLRRSFNPLALEALSYWPQVAWFDLREPRFWDAHVTRLADYGLPLHPATPPSLLQALRHFLAEQGGDPARLPDRSALLNLAEPVGAGRAEYVEQLLGDALPWAEACALVQPVSPGLADALRRHCFPQLPPQRIERLYRLPDTRVDQAGLSFQRDVLAFLRRSCLERRSLAERERLLDRILAEIKAVEPEKRTSLAHLSWEALEARVRLERDPDDDLARLAQLAHEQSPLRGALRASLEGFSLPPARPSIWRRIGALLQGSHPPTPTSSIPLLLRPQQLQAQLRLSRIADGVAPPSSRIQLAAIGSFMATGVALLGLSALLWVRAAPVGPPLVVTFPAQYLAYVGLVQAGAPPAGVGLTYGEGGPTPLNPGEGRSPAL